MATLLLQVPPSVRWLPSILLGIASLAVAVNASAQEPAPEEEDAVVESVLAEEVAMVEPVLAEPSFQLEGRLDLSYRYRTQQQKNIADSDAYLSIYLDGVSKDGAGEETLRFHLDGYASMDFNGPVSSSESFFGLADTRGARLRPFLYGAWAESGTLLPGAKVRVGRQEIHREDALYFDGARADFGDRNWKALVYAGAPVRFYESSRSGDLLGGVGLRWWVQPSLRFGFDQVFLRDAGPPADSALVVNDNLTILSGHWLQSQTTSIEGSSSWINGRPRRAEIRARTSRPQKGMWSQVSIRRQNDDGEVVATDLSPFAATLGDVRPYWSASFSGGRELMRQLDLSLGFQGRWLENGGDEGLYNREYERWFGTLTKRSLWGSHWGVGLRADLWGSTDTSIFAGGAFANYEAGPGRVLELGTDYSKYRYDAFTGREYLDDRQVYLRLSYPLVENTSLRIRLARDGSQLGSDYLAEISVGWEF